jgi:transposase
MKERSVEKMGFISGENREQQTYWALEDMIDEENMIRLIDRFVEGSDLKALGFNRTKAAATGRPGYAAGSMTKLYIYGYINGIRSSRRLEKETRRNIEMMWLMQGLTPDHSSISEFRQMNGESLKKLFREFVLLCKSWELTGGGAIAQDGSKISASNSHKNNVKANTVDARIKRIDEKIAEYMESMDQADQSENREEGTAPEAISPKKLMELLKRRGQFEECKKQMEETGTEETSITDPDARMMGSPGKGFDIAYNLQIAVDSKHHIILDCEVINNPTDRGEMNPMASNLIQNGHINPHGDTAYLADRGYYSGEDLAKMKELGIKAIVPRQNPPHRKDQPEMFWCTRFRYDADTNTYTCPAGHTLYPAKLRNPETKRISYRNKHACKECPHKGICTNGKEKYRTIKRGEYADICEAADFTYEENKQIYNLRRELAEHPFGTIKRYMNGSYFLLRTLCKVRGEAALLCLAYNFKRVTNILDFKDIMARLDERLRFMTLSFDFLFPLLFNPVVYPLPTIA